MGAFVEMPRVIRHPRRGFQSLNGIHKPCLHTSDRDINIPHDTSTASYNYASLWAQMDTRVGISRVKRSREAAMAEQQPLHDPDAPDPCPLCGSPYTMITIVGPDEAVLSPCGCRLPPWAVE